MRLGRSLERLRLKLQGVDPDELENDLKEIDEARRRRERERREAVVRARHRADEIAMNVFREDR
jgi:hypothetical protein